MPRPVPYYRLFRYATGKDWACIVTASVSAVLAGASFPICNVFAAEISAKMIEIEGDWFCDKGTNKPYFTTNKSSTPEFMRDFTRTLETSSIYLGVLAVAQFFLAYLAIWSFNVVAENQTYKVKAHYLRALLRQDISWYDTNSDITSLTHLTEDMPKIHEAIGTKLGLFIYYASNSVICVITALIYGWLLTLITLVVSPISFCASAVVEVIVAHLSVKHQAEFSKCGIIIQQTVLNIKTVMAFNGQRKQIEKFEAALDPAHITETRQQMVGAFGLGLSYFLKYCSYALSLWYAAKLFYDDVDKLCCNQRIYNSKTVMIILFNVLDFESNLSECMAFLETFSEGKGAAVSIFEVIDREPDIDSLSDKGIHGDAPLSGKIEFKNVYFSYPSRPQIEVIKGLDLTIQPGMTLALIGASGSGKSTCLQLLQRFYDPKEGEILVDGIDIRNYNVKWYRSQIAVVNQDPVLFDTTIEENIKYGKPDISQEMLEKATKLAQAHRFIERLPNKYKTRVGEGGTQLSGGQKQRVAICRALIQNPSILMLDEITSALDVAAEAAVHKAVQQIKRGRTTIIVAHRLATLRNADVIAIVHDGRIAAYGSPTELGKLATMYIGRLLMDAFADVDEESLENIGSDQSIVTVTSAEMQGYEDSDDENGRSPGQSGNLSPEISSLCSFGTIVKLVAVGKNQWPLLLMGVLMCLVHGFLSPLTSYVFGQSLHVFAKDDRRKAEKLMQKYSIIFVFFGAAFFFTQFLSLSFFGCAGGKLSGRLRKMAFDAMMRQGLTWFHHPENNVGAICARFSRDIVSIEEATGPHFGLFLGAVATVLFSIGLSFYLDWRLASAAWAFAPLVLIGGYCNGKLVENEGHESASEEHATTIVFQAISNIRTVSILNLHDFFLQQFTEELDVTYQLNKRKAHVLGFVFAISQGISSLSYAALLYYGGILVKEMKTDHANVFTIGEGVVATSLEVGLTLAYVVNYSKAKVAAARLYDMLMRKVGTEDEKGRDITDCSGGVMFDHVDFSFASNRRFMILRDMTWDLKPGSHLAVCGPSGSGKTTLVELILRFYDPTSGRICLDNVDLKDIRPESLRSQMAIVSQEPALFDASVAENIAYGLGSGEAIDMDVVEGAARQADIHEFIMTLPAGYDTPVGTFGAQLSGGQKQRVAIARALATNPKILLLDEATSALDAGSEDLVEQAIENSRIGRTSVTVAHKLGLVQHADKILVLSNGQIAEQGTHEELMNFRGIYYHMYHLQYGHHVT